MGTIRHDLLAQSEWHESQSDFHDANGNPAIKAVAASSAVNWLDVLNAATGNPVKIQPNGTDTDIDLELLAQGAGEIILRGQEMVKKIVIASPGSSEDRTLFFTNKALTITNMRAVVRGSTPSVTWTIRHNSDRSAAGNEVVTGGTTTTSQSTGSNVTAFNDETIPANSWVWLETTAASGTNNELAVILIFVFD